MGKQTTFVRGAPVVLSESSTPLDRLVASADFWYRSHPSWLEEKWEGLGNFKEVCRLQPDRIIASRYWIEWGFIQYQIDKGGIGPRDGRNLSLEERRHWAIEDIRDHHSREVYEEPDGTVVLFRRLEEYSPPWQDKHNLEVKAYGGLYNRERRRVMVAGYAQQNYIRGHRESRISGDCDITVDESVTSTIAPVVNPGDKGFNVHTMSQYVSSPGRDRMVVHGNARMTGESNTIMGGGIVNRRTWGGGVIRMTPMEGVIVGGGFVRMIAGPSVHLSAMASGDIYGGSAHASGARVYASPFGYRSVELSVWAIGAYVRSTGTTVVPAVGSPSTTFARRSMAAKLYRLSMGILPFAEIAMGILSLLAMPFIMLFNWIQKMRGKPPTPPSMIPRTWTRICVRQHTTGSELRT